MDELKIIFEDENLIGIVKPYGILSTGDNSVEELLRKKNNGYIGVIHRLDRTTQGVMIFSKNEKMTTLLNKVFQEHDIEKEYLCVVEGKLDKSSDTFEDLLYFDRQKNKSFVVDRERKGVKDAKLSYLFLREKDNLSLLKVFLYTGRTHQIRVQFASRKHPLVGDRRYGSKVESEKIMLCSSRLAFVDPIKNQKVELTYIPDYGYFGEMI